MSFIYESSLSSSTLAFFLIHCAALGFTISNSLNLWKSGDIRKNNLYLQWFFAINIGLVLNLAVIFLLGIVGWLNRLAILAAGFVLFVMALHALGLFSRQEQLLSRLKSCVPSANGLTILLVIFIITVLRAFKVPGHWDDTMYHLPLARHYLQHGAIVLHEYLRFPLFPQNIELLMTLGLMFGNDFLAQAFATIPLFIMSIGLIGGSLWLMGSIFPGVLAIVVMNNLHPIKMTVGYAYVENGLALFCWGATLAIAQWTALDKRNPKYHWVIIAGLLAGGACGSKYFGVVFAALLGCYLLIFRRDWKASALYTLAIIVSGSWWYVRNAVISGDPIHPAGGNIFGYYLWNADDLIRQKQEQASFGVPPASLDILGALEKARVEIWILAFASLLFFRKVSAPLRVLQFSFLAYFAFWFCVTQVQRYLAPIYATGSLLTIYSLYRLLFFVPNFRDIFSRLILDRAWVMGILSLFIFLPSLAKNYYDSKRNIANWGSILEQRKGYLLFNEANSLKSSYGPRLVQLGFDNAVYYFDGIVIGDSFGPGRYNNTITCESGSPCRLIAPDAMKRYLDKFDCRMLAVNTMIGNIDAESYKKYFNVVLQTKDGLLLVSK